MSADDGDDLGRIGDAPGDDYPQWMHELAALDDAALDRLLAGDGPPEAPHLGPLAEIAAALRSGAGSTPAPPMSAVLRAQLTAEAPRRRPWRLVVGAAAAALLLAGMQGAAQGALPDPVQRLVARAADWIGVDLPDPADEGRGTHDGGLDEDEVGPGAGGREAGSQDADGRGAPDEPGAPEGRPGGGAPAQAPGSPPDGTPGGATPADPGDPGQPATPATPPAPAGGAGQGADPADPGEPGEPATPATPPSQGKGTPGEPKGSGRS